MVHHPDKGGDPEKFKDISAAYGALTDERKRSAYDSQLRRNSSRDGLEERLTNPRWEEEQDAWVERMVQEQEREQERQEQERQEREHKKARLA